MTAYDICPRTGGPHDWSQAPDRRHCRACGKDESRGQNTECWDFGHRWDQGYYGRCVRCGVTKERDPLGGSGW